MPYVTFTPDDVTVEVRPGENLLRAAMMADIRISASCGGDGTCGKCRVIVESGSVDTKPSAKLTSAQTAEGHVLSCVTTVLGDVTVRIPPESRPGAVPVRSAARRSANTVLSAEDCAARVPRKKGHPPVGKWLLEMSAPNLTDNVSDVTRVQQSLRREHRIADASVSLSALRQLPTVAREGDWTVTATVMEPCEGVPRITGFESGNATARQYAIAVDVGTTTVEVAVVDVRSGETLAQTAEYNSQIAYGEDVISRVIHATKSQGLVELHDSVIDSVRTLTLRACEQAGVSTDDIVCYVAAGNTVMTHLLCEVSPASIRTSPYVPAARIFPWMSAHQVGLPGTAATRLATLPCSASWLGGDIVSGLMAAGVPWTDKLTLFIDIGTNGEIVLGSKEWMVACSCSAGPAFEGGGILHGMRAANGAIESVRIDAETLSPSFLTIGGVKPLGICGSGLIDLVSELLLVGALGRNGKYDPAREGENLRNTDRGLEYVVVPAADSGTGEAIVLTETDVDNLLRAKAAIYAGIAVLAESVDVPLEAIEEVIVAGGFGHYLDLERVTALGMVPELSPERFVFLGNGSLLGAKLAATSREMLKTARRVSEQVTYIELSVNAAFTEAYMSALFFPHTDLNLFPRTEKTLAERSGQGAVI